MAKILIVDDRPANRDFLVTLLGYKGYQLLEASDGAEALEVVRAEHPDLVICDVLMPTMDGFAFVQQLRDEPAIAGTTVVFCTAHYLEREADELARNCGVSHVLTKPAEPQLVLDTVENVLRNPVPSARLEEPDALQREHLRLVTDKLSQTAADLGSAHERLAALVELNLRLASELDPQRLLEQVCLGARQLLGACYAALGIRDRETLRTVCFVTSGIPVQMANAFGLPSVDKGILGNVMTGGRSYRIGGKNIGAVAAGLPAGFTAAHSLLAAPIASPTGTYGWICLTDKLANGEFTEDDERLLSILAAQTGRIYENGSLYRKIQLHAAEMEIEIAERIRAEQELRESELKYRALIEQASDGIFVSDAEGNFMMVNTQGCKLLGYAPDELIGLSGKITYLDDETAIHTQRMNAVSAGHDLRYERMVKRKDGSAFPAEISLKMLDNGMVQVIFHDITARRSQEQKIARLSRIQAVLSGINSAIVRIRDRKELFEEACRIAVEHGGFSIALIARLEPGSEMLVSVAQAGLPIDLNVNDDGSIGPARLSPAGIAEVALRQKAPAFNNDLESVPDLLNAGTGRDTLRVRRAAARLGAKSAIVLPLFVEGQAFGILTLFAGERNFFDDEELKLLTELAGDISFSLEFMAKEEKVDYLAYYDPLTGLANRSLFFDRLTRQLGAAAREKSNVALLLIDLDRFRQVNDTLGRQSGDALLASVAGRMASTVRDRDSLARVGSNRFALAISGNSDSPEVVFALESRNRGWFERPFSLGGEELRISATVGIAMFPADGDNAEALFANAEAALRLAKSQSAPFLFYGPEMNARVAESLRIETRLRRAVVNRELTLWYQPKVDLNTGKITGMEALMRWRDPESGMIPPGKFIPIMEQTGMILEAGNWALSQVALDCKLWAAQGLKLPRIAVNVSPIQLRQKEFVAIVIGAADETETAGGALDLEITESVIMENVDAIIPKLQTVRGLGVEMYIDDFGTGYSSLAYIARLPIHSLKIDRSFIVGMTQSEESLNIVNSVISLAHSLKLRVVAEGVETEAQAALLRQLQCDEFQGYLTSKPVPPEEVPALVRKLS